jgi:hypothetical protein
MRKWKASAVPKAAEMLFSIVFLGLIARHDQTLPGPSKVWWFVAGGVVGALLATALLNWAIIVLSRWAEAAAIVTALDVPPAEGLLDWTGRCSHWRCGAAVAVACERKLGNCANHDHDH